MFKQPLDHAVVATSPIVQYVVDFPQTKKVYYEMLGIRITRWQVSLLIRNASLRMRFVNSSRALYRRKQSSLADPENV